MDQGLCLLVVMPVLVLVRAVCKEMSTVNTPIQMLIICQNIIAN